jgi:hypothetical protein
MYRGSRPVVIALSFVVALAATSSIAAAEQQENVIVKCERPCAAVAAAVAAAGGSVTHRYDNLDALAVTVPANRVAGLSAAFGADAIRKDVTVNLPPPTQVVQADGLADAQTAELAGGIGSLPANYNYNNALTGATSLHTQGFTGANVVVAVIDSGTAAAAAELAGTVLGGENFVPGDAGIASATSRLNDWHGTGVGAMIAAHANFIFANSSRLVQALNLYSPQSVVPCPATCPSPTTQSLVPMVGTAPASRIYALKVFPRQGGGSPESRIIAAMDRVITLRKNFNNGESTAPIAGTGTHPENNPAQFNALNIQVVNMSLGGPTLNAGADLEDQLTVEMANAGITLVVAAGNDGFGAMTIGSPGSGIGGVTVGAASTPVHERVLREIQFQATQPLGIGAAFRPFGQVQMADFSSRGPTADGRVDPDMSANGLGSYVAVFAAVAGGQVISCGHPAAPATGPNACLLRILFVSGTSFASPTTAGAAALLAGAVPSATGLQVRNAIVLGANPAIVADGSGPNDEGAGFLDVPASLALLQEGDVKDELPENERRDDRDDAPDDVGAGGKSVQHNLRKIGIHAVRFHHDRFTASTGSLLPGQVAHYFLPVDIFTDSFTIAITNIVKGATQNVLFTDDLFVQAVDAPTSFAVHRIHTGASDGAFVGSDQTFTIDKPQNGLVRLAIQGDWTNASPISATVTINRHRSLPTLPSTAGIVRQDDVIPYTVTVPAGKTQAAFDLSWLQNWGRYPTNDLDMSVIDPNGVEVVDANGNPPGGTLNSPERVVVANPMAGTWRILVTGFTIQRHADLFTVTATADGKRLKVKK